MARYIDADEFYESQVKRCGYRKPMVGSCDADNIALRQALLVQPTADVVPREEVAREIFEEIEKHLFVIAPIEEFDGWARIQLADIMRLKNKYTGE